MEKITAEKSRRSSRTVLHMLLIMLLDALIIAFSQYAALIVRFGLVRSDVPAGFMHAYLSGLPVQILFTWVFFHFFRLYFYIWRYLNILDLLRIAGFAFLDVLLLYLLRRVFFERLPVSVEMMAGLAEVILFTAMRACPRLLTDLGVFSDKSRTVCRVLLIGAGKASELLMHEFAQNPGTNKVVAIIDDDSRKTGRYFYGAKVIGGRDKIENAVKSFHVQKIVFAIPSASEEERQKILDICARTGVPIRVMPEMNAYVNNKSMLSQLQDIRIEDLLGRKPASFDREKISAFIHGKTVLVTGGGGSIGSELCRQVAKRSPKTLIILDINENYVYMLDRELRQKYGSTLDIRLEIASVRDKDKLEQLFSFYRPDIVLHAAAHKHVPLMEHNPEEAVKNNIFGTYHVIRCAEKTGVKKVVLISTDKAVNPTNFMGATKRFCELVLMSRPKSDTALCAVRFGNVLGSNGSVIPIFRKQIEAGGPVTITDKRIVRYFMTIPEAAQLVLEAGAMAEDKQIFVLDMGKPVSILELAEKLIRLHNLEPYTDIPIVETGLRPGEKLYEELLTEHCALDKTPSKSIYIEKPEPVDAALIAEQFETLDRAVTEHMPATELIALLKSMVPTYKSPEEVNPDDAATEEDLRRLASVKR